jgi:hypothetical protein
MKLLKAFSAVSVLFVLTIVVNAARFQYGIEDAFWRTFMTPFEGTVWAPQFEESRFSKIKVGMSAPEVLKLLGHPLRKDCGNEDCFWIYTWHDTGTTDFDQRWVIFSLVGRVIEVRKSFFID